LSSLKIEETKKQAQGSKSAQSSSKAPLTASTASKPTAYRPPQAKRFSRSSAEAFWWTCSYRGRDEQECIEKQEAQRETGEKSC